MSQEPVNTDRNKIIVIAGMAVALLILLGLLAFTLLSGDDEQPAAPTPSATFSQSPTPDSVEVPTPQVEDGHGNGDDDEAMAATEKGKVIKTSREYVDAWLSVEGEKARRKALSGLASPAHIDLVSVTDPRNMLDAKRVGDPVLVASDAYSGSVKVTLSEGDPIYLMLLRDPSAKHDWVVAYLYPEDDFLGMFEGVQEG